MIHAIRRMVPAASFVFLCATGAFAAVSFNGTGDWPTAGDIEIPNGATVTVSSADEVAAVSGWTSVTFLGESSTLAFANASGEARLNAVLIGRGAVTATGSAGLVIAADNRDFAGFFNFTDSAVTVASDYGLGGPKNRAATSVTFTKSATVGSLKFHWDGQKAFTNHCALVYYCDNAYTAADGKMYLGSSAADEYFVQDADFTLGSTVDNGNTLLKFRNNYEQISGTFGIESFKASYSFFATGGDANAIVKFSGTTGFRIANTKGNTVFWYIMCNGTTQYRFASTGGYCGGHLQIDVGNIIIDGDNPFPSVSGAGTAPGLVSINANLQDQKNYKNLIDLNGHTLSLQRLNGAAPDLTKDKYARITNSSAEPASLLLVGDDNGADYAATPVTYQMSGKLSLTVNNNATNHFWLKVSSVDGALNVVKGGVVFDKNAGWDGPTVRIDGGAIDARSTESFKSGKAALTITAGSLKLHDSVPVSFTTAEIGGTILDPSDYTVAQLRDDFGLGDYVTGDDTAVLSVGGATTWTGWPDEEGGTAFVPKNMTVTITDADVAKVEKLGRISLGMGSTVVCQNTVRLNLTAALSGMGTFKIVDNAAGVTILGNNSKLLAPGAFWIENSNVAVSNRFGLGSATTGAATVYYGLGRTLTFGLADSNVFTNGVAIHYKGLANSNESCIFGSESADEWLVQDADFLHQAAALNNAQRIVLKNNVKFISGTFGTTDGSIAQFTTRANGHVWFAGSTFICVGSPTGAGKPWFAYGSAYHWAHGGGTHLGNYQHDTGTDFIEADGLFSSDGASSLPSVNWCPYHQNQDNYKNLLDLQGHDVAVQMLASVGQSLDQRPTWYSPVTSATPATLSLVGDYQGRSCGLDGSIQLQGKTSLTVDNNGTNSFVTKVSSPDGALTLKSGAVTYSKGAGWDGTALVIEDGAFVCNCPEALAGGHSALTMTGGRIAFTPNCAYANFASATIGGTTLDPDSYTLAQLRDEYGLGDYFAGDDAVEIRVVGSSGEWTGWPEEPGAVAEIPRNTTVYIRDDDVAKVSQLGKIILGLDSKLVCETTVALAISCPISGYGQIRIVDNEAGVTLLGDSSKLLAPGAFYIENSNVAVSNRFGLGSVRTGAATVIFTDRRLRFGLADSCVFTNDVAIHYQAKAGVNNAVCLFGSASTDEYLVQNADFLHLFTERANYGSIQCLRPTGNVEFRGKFGLKESKYNELGFFATDDAVVRFGETCTFVTKVGGILNMNMYGPAHPHGVVWSFDCAERANANVSWNIGTVVPCRDNVFGDPETTATRLFYFRNPERSWNYMTILDLQGHDIACAAFDCQSYEKVVNRSDYTSYAVVTSGVESVLTLASASQRWEVLKFRGEAGFRYAGTGTNLFVGVTSDSTGSYRVSSGVSGFDWGAKWSGSDITVDGTGTLYVGAESAGVFGTKAEAKAKKVVLNLKDSGKLYLEEGANFVYEAFRGDGSHIARGIYTAANCDWIEGEGSLRIIHDDGGALILVR